MAVYRVESHLRDGSYLAELPYRNLQWEHGINGPYGARFDLPLYHDLVQPATVEEGLHEIWIYRDDVRVFIGPLWDVVASSSEKNISCNAMSAEDYFDVRLVGNQSYTAVDQCTIAWNYVNTSQLLTGGDLGITQGTLGAGISRSVKWKQFDGKYVLEAIQDMSDMVNGFDFRITPSDKKFNAYFPRLQRNNNLTLEFPYGIRKYTVQKFGKWVRNSIYVSAKEPQVSNAIDTTSRTKFGLREYADSFRDAPTVTDLNNYASKLRDLRANQKNYPTIMVNVDAGINPFDSAILQLGDLVQIVIADGYINYNQQMRYFGGQITVDKQGGEAMNLYFQDLRELN